MANVISEEAVRTLLKLNPGLRESLAKGGATTIEVTDAAARTVEGQGPPPASTPPRTALSLAEELARIAKTFAAARAETTLREKALAARREALAREARTEAAVCCEELVRALIAVDRNVAQRRNQAILEQEKAFLAEIGFSLERVLAAERRGF